MFRRNWKLLGVFSFFIAIIGFSIYAYMNKPDDVLLVYGPREYPNGICQLFYIDPHRSLVKDMSSFLPSDADCYPSVAHLNKKTWLFITTSTVSAIGKLDTKIIIYQVIPEGTLVTERTISLGNIELTSDLEIGPSGEFYFSGIVDGEERIYRGDTKTGEVVIYISYDESFATYPIISPNGHHLAYMIPTENATNKNECMDPCFLGYFHIWDIEKQTDIDLLALTLSLLELPEQRHCGVEWSPTGRWLSIMTECLIPSGPQSNVVYDTLSGEVVMVLDMKVLDMPLRGWWRTKNELITNEQVSEGGDRHYRYISHSVLDGTQHELFDFGDKGIWESGQANFRDWTEDGDSAAGWATTGLIQQEENQLISAVIVNKAMTDQPQVHYASLPLGASSYHTVWSLSEELLAVSMYPYSHIADGPYRTWIMDNNGQIMMDVVSLEIGYPGYLWIRQ